MGRAHENVKIIMSSRILQAPISPILFAQVYPTCITRHVGDNNVIYDYRELIITIDKWLEERNKFR